MSCQLHDHVLPQQLAEQRQVIDCKVQLQEFGRLLEIVQADLALLSPGDRPANWRHAPVGIRLNFDFAPLADATPMLEGEVSTTLDAVCQRCLESCRVSLDMTLRYLLLPSDAGTIEYDGYEVWELADQRVRPLDIIEEALVMALPLPALHGSVSECGPLAGKISSAAADTTRPFAGLRAQLDESK